MPGIVGLITRMPRQRAERQLLQMIEALAHEPFYETGTWVDESLGVYVGWVARKGSFAAGMPLRNERGDVTLVFAGEEFSPLGTSADLRARGHSLDLDGPSYMVHLYEEDARFPATLNGRFHGLVMDRARGVATLFNDRYGMGRIYGHEAGDAFYFGAEAKALLAVRPELRRLDVASLGEFVACGCALDGRTLFAGVSLLPPAASWTFRAGTLERKATYFRPGEWEDAEPLAPASYRNEIRRVFAETLPRYFRSTDGIGMSLTGGLDTRMIMAWHRARPGALPCYTFGGTFRDSQDVVVAREVARLCRQSHQVIPLGPEFLSAFSRYAERTVYLTDGCIEVSHAADLYLNERAREIAPVRVTGNYGGEVLRRVRAFKPMPPFAGLFAAEVEASTTAATSTYERVTSGHPLSFAVFRQAPWHHHGLLALEETQLSLRSPYLDNDFVRTVFRAPAALQASLTLCLRLIEDGSPALLRVPTDAGQLGRGGPIAAAARQRALQFLKKAEYAYDYGMPQWLARVDRALAPLQPERLFLGRNKFAHFRVWYRDALSPYIQDILLDPRSLARPYVVRGVAEKIVRDHVAGTGNYTSEIHKLLTLELLHRLFLDA
jgi:asparagine synthase (glutamine-hydrolysing)